METTDELSNLATFFVFVSGLNHDGILVFINWIYTLTKWFELLVKSDDDHSRIEFVERLNSAFPTCKFFFPGNV